MCIFKQTQTKNGRILKAKYTSFTSIGLRLSHNSYSMQEHPVPHSNNDRDAYTDSVTILSNSFIHFPL